MSEPTILVTGAGGFIARHVVRELLQHGYRVRGTLRSLARADAVRATLAPHADVGRLELVEADLLRDAGWEDAARGVHGVLHVASPYPVAEPKDPDELIRPAVEGTLRVLRAAVRAGARRFVQTSSLVAVANGHPPSRTAPFTPADWSVLDGPVRDSYTKSKTLAERAAREFVAGEGAALHFSTINPGFVLGPVLDRDWGTSGEAILMFLRGKYPGCPRLAFPVVDVRDVALLHRLALETDAPSGGRWLAASETAWFVDMMRPIKAQLGADAKKVPLRNLPDFVLRLVALFDPAARRVLHDLGAFRTIDTKATRETFGIAFRPVTESAPAMARSLVEMGALR